MIKNIKSLKIRLKKYKKKIIILVVFIIISAFPMYVLSYNLQGKSDLNTATPETGITVYSDKTPSITIHENMVGDQKLQDILIKAIKNTKESINIAIYSFDIKEIKEEIMEAGQRGVRVEIFTTYEKKEQLKQLFSNNHKNINITFVGEEMVGEVYNMHHKFIITDPDSEQATLLTGPWNWTYYQEDLDPNILLEIHDPDIIGSYMEEIQRLKNNQYSYGKFNDINYHPRAKKINYRNGDSAEVWLSPGRKQNSMQDKIIDMIQSSTKSIDIAVTIFDADQIAEEIIKKANLGVKVRILTNKGSENVYKTSINRLQEAKKDLQLDNLEILFEGTASTSNLTKYSIFHHNYLIIDNEAVFTGTANWTYSGFYINDENALIFYSPEIASQFTDIFSKYVL